MAALINNGKIDNNIILAMVVRDEMQGRRASYLEAALRRPRKTDG
jgi:hypothetical protein